MSVAVTPWGETFAGLADAILADRDAPPFLALAAFLAKHGDDSRLRSLVADAVALNAAEAANSQKETRDA